MHSAEIPDAVRMDVEDAMRCEDSIDMHARLVNIVKELRALKDLDVRRSLADLDASQLLHVSMAAILWAGD
jgi:hypothetical protein